MPDPARTRDFMDTPRRCLTTLAGAISAEMADDPSTGRRVTIPMLPNGLRSSLSGLGWGRLGAAGDVRVVWDEHGWRDPDPGVGGCWRYDSEGGGRVKGARERVR